MNPYTKLSPSRQAAHERAPLFAPEVYLEDDDLLPAKPEKKDPMVGELARLRNELRGEARALRTQMARPQRVPAELLAEIATLRAAVDELLANSTHEDSDNTLASVLRRRGIEGGAASAITRVILTAVARADEDVLLTNELLREAAAMIVKTAPWPAKTMAQDKSAKMLIALVGPAGVGKTTTAAKLAARAKMARKSVALVSCDSFRVGAMDQLQKYAELMEATFHSVTTQDELLEILGKETADVIIVDTSGRAVQADATEALLGASDVRVAASSSRRVEVLLCVPASLRANDAARAHRDFAAAQPTGLVVTKTDETDTPAGILHAAFATRLPVTTICNGQRVPEDIHGATDENVGALLFPNNGQRKGNVSK